MVTKPILLMVRLPSSGPWPLSNDVLRRLRSRPWHPDASALPRMFAIVNHKATSLPKRTHRGVKHDRGDQITLRSDRDWRGRGRHLPDQAAGRSRGRRHGAGWLPRPRRDLVPEPLSGRAFRFRELHLRLFLLAGIAR